MSNPELELMASLTQLVGMDTGHTKLAGVLAHVDDEVEVDETPAEASTDVVEQALAKVASVSSMNIADILSSEEFAVGFQERFGERLDELEGACVDYMRKVAGYTSSNKDGVTKMYRTTGKVKTLPMKKEAKAKKSDPDRDSSKTVGAVAGGATGALTAKGKELPQSQRARAHIAAANADRIRAGNPRLHKMPKTYRHAPSMKRRVGKGILGAAVGSYAAGKLHDVVKNYRAKKK
jgi:hypothetical protein